MKINIVAYFYPFCDDDDTLKLLIQCANIFANIVFNFSLCLENDSFKVFDRVNVDITLWRLHF